jgi:hypothetical protein
MGNKGKDFEHAVFAMLQALGPDAKIYFDHKIPDRDTGTSRQCDAWIEGLFLDHFPIKYLISCKDKSRKLNIEDKVRKGDKYIFIPLSIPTHLHPNPHLLRIIRIRLPRSGKNRHRQIRRTIALNPNYDHNP